MTAKHGREKISRRPRSGMSAKDVSGRVHQVLGVLITVFRESLPWPRKRGRKTRKKKKKERGKRTEVKMGGNERGETPPRFRIINARLDLAGHLVGFDSLERAMIEII